MIAPLIANTSKQLDMIGSFIKSPSFMISPKHLSKVKFIPENVAVDQATSTMGTLIYFLRGMDLGEISSICFKGSLATKSIRTLSAGRVCSGYSDEEGYL